MVVVVVVLVGGPGSNRNPSEEAWTGNGQMRGDSHDDQRLVMALRTEGRSI